jgi:UDP-N-acetyl-D-galactosamine dehydrogenase
MGYNPEIILAGRRMNDGMGAYVVDQTIKHMLKKGIQVLHSNVIIMGFTFKENCPDIRNTKIVDIYHTLTEYTHNITIYDPWADKEHVKQEYGVDIVNKLPEEEKYDACILAVAHNEFLKLNVRSLLKQDGVVYDVKGILPRDIIDSRL